MACLRAGGALAVSAVWHNLEKSAALPIGAAASTIALNACVAASCTTFGAPPEATPSNVAVQCSSAKPRPSLPSPVANAVAQRQAAAATTLLKLRSWSVTSLPMPSCFSSFASFWRSSGVRASSPSFVKALRPSTRSSHSSDLSSCWTFWRVCFHFYLFRLQTV